MRFQVRELDEREAVKAIEIIGDTPILGVFDTEADAEFGNQIFAVTLTSNPVIAGEIAEALNGD